MVGDKCQESRESNSSICHLLTPRLLEFSACVSYESARLHLAQVQQSPLIFEFVSCDEMGSDTLQVRCYITVYGLVVHLLTVRFINTMA